MRLADRAIGRLRAILFRSDAGITVWRLLGQAASRLAPYDPPRAELTPERTRAFVPVEVRESSVPGAGLGLFSRERIAEGVVVGEYTGDVVDSWLRLLRTRNRDYVILTDVSGIAIDAARRPEVEMRYICHHPRPERRNVRYRTEGPRAFVVTTRVVEAGEELLTDYGPDYWRLRRIVPAG